MPLRAWDENDNPRLRSCSRRRPVQLACSLTLSKTAEIEGCKIFYREARPWSGVTGGGSPRSPARAGDVRLDCRQADGWIIAQGCCFQRHVAGTLESPFIVLLEQDG